MVTLLKIYKEVHSMAYQTIYTQVGAQGRGAGTDKPYTISEEIAARLNTVDSSIRALSAKSGMAVKKINGGGKALSGFINWPEMNVMDARVKFAQHKIVEAICNPTAATEAEYVFRMGNFKGKTPSQLLLEGTSEADLLAQREFLGRNLSGQYAAANKKGIADIDAAIAKFKEGKLSASEVKSSIVPVFKSGPRYFVKKVPQPYTTEGWELNITCNPSEKNPFIIEWQSKTVTIEKNMIVKSENMVVESAALTETEFIDVWNTAFSKLTFLENADVAERISYANAHKDDYKKNMQTSPAASQSSGDDMPFR
jgi:hypothetical protein